MALPAELRRHAPEADAAHDTAIHVPAPAFVHADAEERLFAPVDAPQRADDRRRLAMLFAGFLLVHAGLLGLFFATVGFEEPVEPEQEIAVEVVPPPEPQQPPPPEQQKPPPEKREAEKPPPPNLDLRPATDAPRAPNKETVDRDAPDKETSTRNVAKPVDPGTAGKPAETPTEAKSNLSTEVDAATEKAQPDRPDAEVIEHAENKPDALRRFTSPEPKAHDGANVPTIAQMMARLEPIPDYKLSGAAPPAPVSGGTAKPNYLSILYGMVVPKFRATRPPGKRVSGKIVIYIDTVGHILHAGVLQPSGSQAVDDAAMAAVRRAAPFPPPPAGLPAVTFSYE